MKTRQIFLMLFVVSFVIFSSCSRKGNKLGFERERSFNAGWKFTHSDVPSAELGNFDDSSWRDIILPHDWSIEDLPEKEGIKQIGPFSENSEGGAPTGHVVGGIGWYRKHFALDKGDKNKNINILFDGVYMDADFWLNGQHLGTHPYGYTAFAFDLTPYLKPPGEDNILAVRIKNEGKNSRWYNGSGIYRNVVLIKTNPVFVDLWGTQITTSDVSKEKVKVGIKTKLISKSQAEVPVEVLVSILNPAGVKVGETRNKIQSLPGNSVVVGFWISLEKIKYRVYQAIV